MIHDMRWSALLLIYLTRCDPVTQGRARRLLTAGYLYWGRETTSGCDIDSVLTWPVLWRSES